MWKSEERRRGRGDRDGATAAAAAVRGRARAHVEQHDLQPATFTQMTFCNGCGLLQVRAVPAHAVCGRRGRLAASRGARTSGWPATHTLCRVRGRPSRLPRRARCWQSLAHRPLRRPRRAWCAARTLAAPAGWPSAAACGSTARATATAAAATRATPCAAPCAHSLHSLCRPTWWLAHKSSPQQTAPAPAARLTSERRVVGTRC